MTIPAKVSFCPFCEQELPHTHHLSFNMDAGVVMANGRMASLTGSQMEILAELSRKEGRILNRKALINALYPHEPSEDEKPGEKVIDVAISHLRKHLKPLGVQIQTHWGKGYSLSIKPLQTPDETEAYVRKPSIGKRVKTEEAISPRAPIKTPSFSWIPLEALIIDHSYQRDLRPSLVRTILSDFDWSRFRPPSVTPVDENRYAVFEGQHATEAARLHPDISEIPCYVVEGMDLEEQAKAFLDLNSVRYGLNHVEQYHARVTAGERPYREVDSLLKRLNLEIQPTMGMTKPGMISSPAYLIKLYQEKGQVRTEEVLGLLRDAQPENPGGLQKFLISGVDRFLDRHPDTDRHMLQSLFANMDYRYLKEEIHQYTHIRGGDGGNAFQNLLDIWYFGENRALR